MNKTLAVIGSRTFEDYKLLKETLNEMTFDRIVSGGARGADNLAERYAAEFGIPIKIFGAEWDRYGKSAGRIRNRVVIDYCHEAIAFWNGNSPGTEHAIKCCHDLGRPYKIIKFEEPIKR